VLAALKVSELLEKTASSEPVPGGGSIAALSAASAAGLAEMVANLTVGKKGFEAVEEEMRAVAAKMKPLREKLLNDMDRDADAYSEVFSAFKLPKHTEEEKAKRQKAIQKGLKQAALVPLEVAEDAFRIMESARTVVGKGNKNAVTDGAVAAMMARTAVLSALYNVNINLASIKDETFVDEIEERAKRLEAETIKEEREIRCLF
jgi:formiminotetrahydrofolate cyclodeaminase